MSDDHRRRYGPDRAVSTVLDAAIFLLLVSAAIGLLYAAPQSDDDATPDPDIPEAASTTLATSTATIEYVPAPDGRADDSAGNRTARGTIAELLAETTVANARLDGDAFTRAPNHERAVRNATRRALAHLDGEVAIQVRTRWRPLGGSGLRGGVTVGPEPPADADVHAATMMVPVGTATSAGAAQSDWQISGAVDSNGLPGDGSDTAGDHSALRHGRDTSVAAVADDAGCGGLAHVLGSRVVGTAFPPERTTLAVRAGGPSTATTERRYATAARALGLDPASLPLERVRLANELLATTLARPLAATCRTYDSPTSAARRSAPGVVLVSVRTWSP
jgi:hypothetical protein